MAFNRHLIKCTANAEGFERTKINMDIERTKINMDKNDSAYCNRRVVASMQSLSHKKGFFASFRANEHRNFRSLYKFSVETCSDKQSELK